jgi:hypothetical protein
MKLSIVIWQAALACVISASSGPVFPAPRQIEVRGQGLKLTESIPILLPRYPLLRTCFWRDLRLLNPAPKLLLLIAGRAAGVAFR